jgi:methoxymalonate biosynthesis protein
MPENPIVKCLVWDLDNTLWRGTLLEDDEVVLTEPIRDLIKTFDSRGILQSICSKNDHDQAMAKLAELGVAEYFVLPHISWEPKSGGVKAIADALNFAYGAMAFVDDQPAERAEVEYHLPLVRCYPSEDLVSLADRPEFSPATVTSDARRRREMYRAGFLRKTAQQDFTGSDQDFLRSLDLEIVLGRAGEDELSRVEELTLRTSQMNATGVHYSDAALRGLLDDPCHEVLVTTMTDRFGPLGAVGVVLLAKQPQVWHLKLLATSCRVVSFGAGTVIMNWLVDQAAKADAHIVADFRPTDRNRIMEIAYRLAGFTDEPCPCATALAPVDGVVGLQRLHLVPARQQPPTALRLVAPELGDGPALDRCS